MAAIYNRCHWNVHTPALNWQGKWELELELVGLHCRAENEFVAFSLSLVFFGVDCTLTSVHSSIGKRCCLVLLANCFVHFPELVNIIFITIFSSARAVKCCKR